MPHNWPPVLSRASFGVGLTALLLLGTAVSAQAFPGANGAVVFTRCNPGATSACDGSDIVTIDPVTKLETPLTDVGTTSYEEAASWSADGKRLVFEHCRFSATGGCGLVVMNADGSGKDPITPAEGTPKPFDLMPAFSPDGTKIVFQGEDFKLFVIGSAGGPRRPLTFGSSTFFDSHPVFSPDGTKIAFTRSEASGSRVWVMNADGSGPDHITDGPMDASPQWSPDGTRIVFQREDDIWAMNADGTNQAPLTTQSLYEYAEPAFSPDGTKIVFEIGVGFGSCDIVPQPLFVMNADGSGASLLTPAAECDYRPDWQPLPPVFSSAPSLTGKARNGRTLRATAGTTVGGGTTTLQFLRCARDGGGCAPIPGAVATHRPARAAATTATYKLTSTDIGHAIRVRQTQANPAGSSTSDSAPTKAVAPNPKVCSNVFAGRARRDVFRGTRGGDRFTGLGGNDFLAGGRGGDCLSGGKGKDRISGGSGNDRLTGGGGNDKLTGGKGTDNVSGGAADDKLNLADGKRDKGSCGKGKDSVRADRKDRLRGCERVRRVGGRS